MGTAPVGGEATGAVLTPSRGGWNGVSGQLDPRGATCVPWSGKTGRYATHDTRDLPKSVGRHGRHGAARDTASAGGSRIVGVDGITGVHPSSSPGDQPRRDRSISGLPARGYSSPPTMPRGAPPKRCSRQLYRVVFRHGKPLGEACVTPLAGQERRPARTASAISRPASAPATTLSAQWSSQTRRPARVPVPYAASAP